ncbi:hypothetical protein TOPH_06906 [Tolypocladium ophioglossoides CBS 100239]|uniref:Uncharacterized protein n=1 Tax=Tolypocladium ophioglossoides (strain CBS 100239) TaxID=1163406 RepID=A0A0L0N3I1_TOLOC|nr:hypothetical protein TOPH_06906 [Tolypocladium ophioglossoides CBS 100239]
MPSRRRPLKKHTFSRRPQFETSSTSIRSLPQPRSRDTPNRPFTWLPLEESAIFGTDSGRTPWVIEGHNQTLHWRQCLIKVYEKDEKGMRELKAEYDLCSGKGKVPKGTEIHLGGIGGVWKVTEE